jgi:hypothetical protein
LGSFFAGIKAGTLSGVFYVGGLAVFNVFLLYALKPDVLKVIQNSYGSICSPAAGAINGTVEDCFSSVVSVDVPYIAFVGFIVALLYAGLLGRYFDSLPGRSQTIKGETVAALVGLNLVFFGFSGFYFNSQAAAATSGFLVVWTLVFGYLLGRLYKKYTRVVTFSSQDAELLRVLVDGSDLTGKTKTFAATSNHKLRAQVADDASFKEWVPSGGVTLEDSRSFETVMEVNGDGSLGGKVGKKY